MFFEHKKQATSRPVDYFLCFEKLCFSSNLCIKHTFCVNKAVCLIYRIYNLGYIDCYRSSARSSSLLLKDKYFGAISKTVIAPTSPFWCILYAARAYATIA